MEDIVFIHIPKNAGTSIKNYLKAHGIHTPNKHFNWMKEKRDCFSFAVARNPWDRHLSIFLHWHRLGVWKNNVNFADYIYNLNNLKRIAKKRNQLGLVKSPQYKYLINENGQIGVQHILKFENLNEDFKIVQNHLGLSGSLDRVNYTKHGHYMYYYTDEMMKIVEKVSVKDIQLFGYERK